MTAQGDPKKVLAALHLSTFFCRFYPFLAGILSKNPLFFILIFSFLYSIIL